MTIDPARQEAFLCAWKYSIFRNLEGHNTVPTKRGEERGDPLKATHGVRQTTQIARTGAATVMAAALLMAGSLGEAGNANATCVGISGINLGSGCQSTFGSIAIGIGNGAVAYALGPLNFAVTLGNQSRANAYNGIANLAIAIGEGAYASADTAGNFAVAVGNGAAASAGGVLNLAVALGDPGENAYYGLHRTEAFIQGSLNVAAGLFGGSSAITSGLPNLSVAIGGGYASAGGLQIKLALPGQVNGSASAAAKRPSGKQRRTPSSLAHRADPSSAAMPITHAHSRRAS